MKKKIKGLKTIKIPDKIMEIRKVFFLAHIKMDFMDSITKETCENNNTEVIVDDNGTLWRNEKHI